MQINPYLMFNGNCEEAFRFYEKHLGGRIVAMMKYSEATPMPEGQAPPEGGCAPDMTGAENLVMHACMEVGGVSLMASDSPPSMPQEKMQGISVTLNLTSEAEARAKGLNVKVAKMPMSHVARALEMNESRGFMKAVIDADSKQILGCAILGVEGGEIMAMIQIAMMGKLPYTTLKDAIFAHPTLAESLNNLLNI